MSKPITKEESRQMFLSAVSDAYWYWSQLEDRTEKERLDGLAFSLMNIFDGTSGGFTCAIDLVLRPHPDDKDFFMVEGADYMEDGLVINDDVYLHDLWCNE